MTAMTAPTAMQIPGFRGDLITPDHHDHDDARAVWNGIVDRRPRLIARASGTADVAAAVRFTRERDLEIAVRGGGHNVAGTAVCDGGIVLDLSAMRASRSICRARGPRPGRCPVGRCRPRDTGARSGHHGRHRGPHRRRRRQPGWWYRLAHAQARAHRRPISYRPRWSPPRARSCGRRPAITPICSGPCEPVAGTLASSACSGSRCTQSAPPSWPDRSSGRPRTPPRSCASTASSSPTPLTSSGPSFRLGTIPPLPVVDEDLHFRPAIAVAGCYAGPVEDGERAVRALRQFRTPLVDLVGPTLYVDHQRSIDDTVPHGWHYYWKATNLTRLSDEVIDIVAALRLRRHLPEVVRDDVPYGWRSCSSASRAPRPTRNAMWVTTHEHRRCMAPGAGRHRRRG